MAKNYDVICFQMRSFLPQLESPLKKEADNLAGKIKKIVTGGKKIKPGLDSLLPHIYNFRIKAIKWLIKEQGNNISGILSDVYSQIEELTENPKLTTLVENILFALRCNRRVAESLLSSGNISIENTAEIPEITYEQFLAVVVFHAPDEETSERLTDWVNASLYIEAVILCAAIIEDENLKVSDKSIKELAFIIADAAQEYSALAIELGILKPRSSKQSGLYSSFDSNFIKEQKLLSELGLDDYAKNLEN